MTEKYFNNEFMLKVDENDKPLAFVLNREITFQYIAGLSITQEIDLFNDEYVINTLRNYVETGSLRSVVELLNRYTTLSDGAEVSCIEHDNQEYIQVKEV